MIIAKLHCLPGEGYHGYLKHVEEWHPSVVSLQIDQGRVKVLISESLHELFVVKESLHERTPHTNDGVQVLYAEEVAVFPYGLRCGQYALIEKLPSLREWSCLIAVILNEAKSRAH